MQTLSSAPDPAVSVAVSILAVLLALTGFGLWTAFGPKAVHRPKPVKAKSNASIVTAIETAGSGADDKVCINFAKFVNNLYISSYTIAK